MPEEASGLTMTERTRSARRPLPGGAPLLTPPPRVLLGGEKQSAAPPHREKTRLRFP